VLTLQSRYVVLSFRGHFLTSTLQTTRYLQQILEVRDAVGPTLMLLGDGNWRMGDGVQAKPNQGKPAPGSESRLIEHYACTHPPFSSLTATLTQLQDDVVNTLIASLTTLSRMQRRPAFGSVFLLNNTAYLCTNLLRPAHPSSRSSRAQHKTLSALTSAPPKRATSTRTSRRSCRFSRRTRKIKGRR
jgi:hypothetical protein